MFVFLLIAFVLVPIAELYVIIKVGEQIGILWTLALLILDSVLGSWLVRSQGRAVWRRFNEALAAGRPPARETLDGGLVIFGGALLLAPGFITDVFGALFLLPPTRALIRRLLVRTFARRWMVRMAQPFAGQRRGPGGPAAPGGFDVDGTAREIKPKGRLRP